MIRVPTRRPGAVDLPQAPGCRRPDQHRALEPDRAPARPSGSSTGSDYAISLVGILFERRGGDFERLQARLPGEIGAAATKQGSGMSSMSRRSAPIARSPAHMAGPRPRARQRCKASFPQATILRPSIVFGPEDGFFNRFARMSQISPALPLIGGGRTRFQPVYVGDVAEAVVAALTRRRAAGRTYELGGPTIYTFKELLTYLLKVTGRRRLLLDLPFGVARASGQAAAASCPSRR